MYENFKSSTSVECYKKINNSMLWCVYIKAKIVIAKWTRNEEKWKKKYVDTKLSNWVFSIGFFHLMYVDKTMAWWYHANRNRDLSGSNEGKEEEEEEVPTTIHNKCWSWFTLNSIFICWLYLTVSLQLRRLSWQLCRTAFKTNEISF